LNVPLQIWFTSEHGKVVEFRSLTADNGVQKAKKVW